MFLYHFAKKMEHWVSDMPHYKCAHGYCWIITNQKHIILANGPSLVTDDKHELLDALAKVDIYGGDVHVEYG